MSRRVRRSDDALTKARRTGRAIRAWRKSLRMTQQTLGTMLNISPQQVCKLERGRNCITLEMLHDIATALDVWATDLFEGTKPSITKPTHS